MGRKRWAERRRPPATRMLVEIDEAARFTRGAIQCGHPLGDGSLCMVPASTEHALSHQQAKLAADLGAPLLPWQERTLVAINVERQLKEGTAKAPAGSGAPAGEMKPSLYRELTGRPYPRRPETYEALKVAAAERAQFTPEQAQEILSAALGTRPHLAARVIDRLGPVLAGELARAVDGAVNGRINRYLADERATLDRLYADQLAKLQTDQERRGRDVNAERWTTPSRLS